MNGNLIRYFPKYEHHFKDTFGEIPVCKDSKLFSHKLNASKIIQFANATITS